MNTIHVHWKTSPLLCAPSSNYFAADCVLLLSIILVSERLALLQLE
jgi:hypothetical protein